MLLDLLSMRLSWMHYVTIFARTWRNLHVSTCILRGGHYIFEHEGIVSNCASAMARGAMVKYWCDAYSWQVKYQFHYSVYGHDGAHELAKEVCRRGEFFFLQWLHQDSDTSRLIWTLMRRSLIGLTGFQCRILTVTVSSGAWKLNKCFR